MIPAAISQCPLRSKKENTASHTSVDAADVGDFTISQNDVVDGLGPDACMTGKLSVAGATF